MNLVERAYLAGIIDGEGQVSIVRRTTYHVPCVRIANTNEALILRVRQILDLLGIGHCVSYQDRSARHNSKPAWTINVESKPRVLAVLAAVAPFLSAKKEQARLVADWCGTTKRRRGQSAAEIAADAVIVDAIRKANHRGRVVCASST